MSGDVYVYGPDFKSRCSSPVTHAAVSPALQNIKSICVISQLLFARS